MATLFIHSVTATFAQKDAKWTEPQPHPCFYGLKISVVNMGYFVYYNWGVKITNHYRTPVTFKYKLIVGGKPYPHYSVAFKLKPGQTHTEGTNHFNSISFENNPSADWSVAISEVCFDGNTCGGANECYAECDQIQGNENQPCDNNKPKKEPALMNGIASSPDDQKTNKGYAGTFTEWQQEGKNVKLTIGQDDNGIYWKKNVNEPPVLFKNIRQGTYRYEVGTDFFIIRFESDNRISFWNNGSLLGYFTKPEEKKKETANKEPDIKSAESSIEDEYWGNGTLYSPMKIKIVSGGINLVWIDPYVPVINFYKVGDNQYQSNKVPNFTLKIINSKRFEYGGIYSKSSLVSKAEKWINKDPATKSFPFKMLYFDNDGVYDIYSGLKVIYFLDKINSTTYMRSDRPCNPDCFKTIYTLTNSTTLKIEYTNLYGQVTQTEYYTKESQ